MIQHRKAGEEKRDSSSPKSVITSLDLKTPTYLQPSSLFQSAKMGVPSKWEDAEKWLISSSCHESPAHHLVKSSDPSKISKQNGGFDQKGGGFPEKVRVCEEKGFRNSVSSFDGQLVPLDPSVALHGASAEVLLKDKFTDNVEPIPSSFQYSEPAKMSFLFKSPYSAPMKDASTEVASAPVQRREVGTEMTPFGSSTNSRSHTPIMSTSPARHNTPASRSGLLVPYNPNLDISELKDCHFAKLELSLQYDSVASNWSTREEEEEEISKSLRHFEISGGRKSGVEFRASAWEEEERAKSCIRYQREEAKIQAWVNLQNAKAEAQSRKLEVKIQKMKSNLEEKLMKRMAIVHRKAEEWRASAQLQHTQQLQKASDYAQKIRSSNLSGQIQKRQKKDPVAITRILKLLKKSDKTQHWVDLFGVPIIKV
ncbi:Remorin [Ananas comosus]|uniref:Remorin n=1 Tax=Ananas comosus TaxID=4615 RepID=A0A199VX71_ANACO|nr:Remorin [Ananas comosus]